MHNEKVIFQMEPFWPKLIEPWRRSVTASLLYNLRRWTNCSCDFDTTLILLKFSQPKELPPPIRNESFPWIKPLFLVITIESVVATCSHYIRYNVTMHCLGHVNPNIYIVTSGTPVTIVLFLLLYIYILYRYIHIILPGEKLQWSTRLAVQITRCIACGGAILQGAAKYRLRLHHHRMQELQGAMTDDCWSRSLDGYFWCTRTFCLQNTCSEMSQKKGFGWWPVTRRSDIMFAGWAHCTALTKQAHA